MFVKIQKSFLILVALSAFSAQQAFSCSEPGPSEFKVSKEVQRACGKMAEEYAFALGQAMIEQEKSATDDVPSGSFKKQGATLYMAKKGKDLSPVSSQIGFNVSLKSKNGWECNFCVDLSFDGKKDCSIVSIYKHMCAK